MNYFIVGFLAGYAAKKALSSQLFEEIKLEARQSAIDIISRRVAERMVNVGRVR